MRLIHRFRCKFDEPYRIRTGFGLSALRSKREIKALIAFCEGQLKDEDHMKLNPDRKAIYESTVQLYKTDGKCVINLPHYKAPRTYHDPGSFVDDHIGWYWS